MVCPDLVTYARWLVLQCSPGGAGGNMHFVVDDVDIEVLSHPDDQWFF